jgi:hypothetical protein
MRCSTTSGLCEPTPCSDGYSCPEGGTCGGAPADEHGCVPLRCEDGFECPKNTRCSADASGHGCDVVRCSGDTSCDCGACVNGTCASGPGHCAPIPI